MSVFRLLRLVKGSKFPVGDRLYYYCALCGDAISSTPEASISCRCGNVTIDVGKGTLFEFRKGTALLLRKIS